MKTGFTALLLSTCLYMVCGRPDFETLQHIQKSVRVGPSAAQLEIELTGPLNLLRGYIYHMEGYMHNKRFYSPSIAASYSLESFPSEDKFWPDFKLTQTPQSDTVWAQLNSTNPSETYEREYHEKLIQLFSWENGELSIENERNGSFIRFLRSEPARQHAMQILAALFLLTERIEAPIECTKDGKSLCIRMKTEKTAYFDITVEVPEEVQGNTAAQTTNKSEIEDIIGFFVYYAKKHHVLQNSAPVSQERFEEGEFLDTLSFLIQVYVFEFIDSASDAKQFIEAVYSLLSDATENGKDSKTSTEQAHADFILKKCFSPVGTANSEMVPYFHAIEQMQRTISICKAFPFVYIGQLPAPMLVPQYDRKLDQFSQTKEYFRNSTEICIYGLFCCFSYNPKEHKYTVGHIKNASTELRKFFEMFSAPLEDMDLEAHKAWSAVVSDISEAEIEYKKEGNEIQCGLLNLLKVILSITGLYESKKEELSWYYEVLAQNDNPEEELYMEIEKYTQSVFELLLKNKKMTVSCKNLKSSRRLDGTADVYGTVCIVYNDAKMSNGISICLTPRGAELQLLPVQNQAVCSPSASLLELKRMYECEGSFMGLLTAQHIDARTKAIYFSSSKVAIPKDAIRELSLNDFQPMNRVLIKGKIHEMKYKKNLIMHFVAYTAGREINAAHPVSRFISNILGRCELDNHIVQLTLLPSLLYNGSYKSCYPNIKISEKLYKQIGACTVETLRIFGHVLDRNDASIVLSCLTTFIMLEKSHGSPHNPLTTAYMQRRIFDCLFKENSTEQIDQVISLTEKYWYQMEGTPGMLRLMGFIHACTKKPLCQMLIKSLYAKIHTNDLTYSNIQYITNLNQLKQTVSILIALRIEDKLLHGIEKLEQIQQFFTKAQCLYASE
ncbi:hypothetical protein NEAUS04_2515 [Nematocida ausubeli]|nr:hypothetical protein NEAUS04_2515 [Nematocida ausubeli]